jgi:hypothetical protein
VPLIPELDGNLDSISVKVHRNPGGTRKETLLSVKAKSSFLSRYPFSTDHLSVRNFSIASRPWKNWSRLRQTESGVYASCWKCQWGLCLTRRAWAGLVCYPKSLCSQAASEAAENNTKKRTDLHFSRVSTRVVRYWPAIVTGIQNNSLRIPSILGGLDLFGGGLLRERGERWSGFTGHVRGIKVGWMTSLSFESAGT